MHPKFQVKFLWIPNQAKKRYSYKIIIDLLYVLEEFGDKQEMLKVQISFKKIFLDICMRDYIYSHLQFQNKV